MPPNAYTVTRREFQDLFKKVEALWKMTVESGTGFQISKSRAGVAISKAKRSEGHPKRKNSTTDIIPVAIVETIGNEDESLSVREVTYTDSPPQTALQFSGDAFTAYPYWGDVSIADYKGFEFTGETPTDETRVFDARKSGSDWILERPSISSTGSTRVGRVLDIIDAASKVGMIQPYRVDDNGNLVNDGPAKVMPYFPGYFGFHFAQHLAWQVPVSLVTIGEIEYIQQTMPWVVESATAATESRCS